MPPVNVLAFAVRNDDEVATTAEFIRPEFASVGHKLQDRGRLRPTQISRSMRSSCMSNSGSGEQMFGEQEQVPQGEPSYEEA